MNTLVVFFSRADENYFGGTLRYIPVGNTEVVCRQICELTGADAFKLEMQQPYSPDYMTCIDEAKRDLQNNARPALVALPETLDEYQHIILAYPNYWGTIPMAAATFLETFDFSGKTIYPLCTNEGSGMGSSVRDVKHYASGAVVKQGLSILGSQAGSSKAAVETWLKRNGLL